MLISAKFKQQDLKFAVGISKDSLVRIERKKSKLQKMMNSGIFLSATNSRSILLKNNNNKPAHQLIIKSLQATKRTSKLKTPIVWYRIEIKSHHRDSVIFQSQESCHQKKVLNTLLLLLKIIGLKYDHLKINSSHNWLILRRPLASFFDYYK